LDSYALPDRQPVGPGASPDNVSIRGGVQGGVNTGINTNFTPTNPNAATSTLDSIARFTQRALAPAIQREREGRFLKGASRVAQGEAAADIEAQQPAWARAFGETDEAMGARAYEGKADAARAELALRDTMDQDAELSPDEYAVTLQSRLSSLETGDEGRDIAWKSQIMGSLPLLMKEHAKAHKAWSQKKALAVRDDALGAHIVAFETAAKNAGPTWSVDDQRTYVSKLLSDIAPVMPGENPEVRDAQLARQLEAQVASGRFATISLFKNTPELWQSLPTGVQDRLEQLTRTRASQEIGKAIGDHPDLWAKVDDLNANPPDTIEGLLSAADAINDELTIRTGIPADLITQNDLFRIWGQQRVRDRQEAKAEAARVKALIGARRRPGTDGDAVKANAALRAFETPGGAERAQRLGLTTARDLANAGDQLFSAADTPEKAAKLLDYAGKEKIPVVEQQVEAISKATQYSPEFEKHAQIVGALGYKRAGELGYWSSPGLLRQVELYQTLLQQTDSKGNPAYTPQLAFQEARARVLAEPIRSAGSVGRKEEVQKLIDKSVESWADPWIGPDQATNQGVGLLKSLLAQEIDKHPVGLSNESAVAAAWGRVQQSAKSIGPHFYLDKSGSKTDVLALMNPGPDGKPLGLRDARAAVPAFEAALSKALGREAKLNEADFMFRIPTQDGDFAFLTTALDAGGKTIPVVIRKADIDREFLALAPKSKGAARARPVVQPAWQLPQYR
jgi:hypothetical protein